MTPEAITLLFQEAREAFPPLEIMPLDNDLQPNINQVNPPTNFDGNPLRSARGVHSLTAILTDPVRYATNHGGSTFVCPSRLPLYNKKMPTMC